MSLLGATRALDCTLIFEPGRLIVGNAGILVTRVLYVKQAEAKTFVIVDAGMNDLIRPTLYDAHHDVRPVTEASPGYVKFSARADRRLVVCPAGEVIPADPLDRDDRTAAQPAQSKRPRAVEVELALLEKDEWGQDADLVTADGGRW